MPIAELLVAVMEWTVTFEGRDEFAEVQRAQLQIEKGFNRLAAGLCSEPSRLKTHSGCSASVVFPIYAWRSRFSTGFAQIGPLQNSWN
jgi:hypothetical protein